MAPFDLYDTTVPIFLHTFQRLAHILTKAEAHCKTHNLPPSDLINASLTPDMKPLPFQIQTCSNTAKGTLVRLAGAEAVSMDDNETTFADLQSRIQRTVDILQAATREGFKGKEDEEMKMKMGPREYTFTGKEYVAQFALPNFYFHAACAYMILRSKGVDIGKADWLGSIGGN